MTFTNEEIIQKFHLDRVPINEYNVMLNQDFRLAVPSYGGRFVVGMCGEVINEDAICTLTPEETKYELMKKFKIFPWQFITEQGENGVRIIFLMGDKQWNVDVIVNAMSACGWFLAGDISNRPTYGIMNQRILLFDPMFGDNIYNDLKRYEYIYHWAPYYAMDSILSDGLIPKNENKLLKHPPRIYFFKTNHSTESLRFIGRQLFDSNKNPKNDGRYVLFSMNVRKLSDKYAFYYDPHLENAVYTTDPIPPNMLEISEIYDFANEQSISWKR